MSDSGRKARSKTPTEPEPIRQTNDSGGFDVPASFTGAMQGLGDEFRDQKIVTERLTFEMGELRHVFHQVVDTLKDLNVTGREQSAATRRLIEVLEGMQMQRSRKNGHAQDDDLSNDNEGNTP